MVYRVPKLTFWRVVAVVLLAAALYAAGYRYVNGLGAATNMSDRFPWGLWVGFDILCGVGLAAGGFTLCAIVYIFNIKRFKPIIRPTVLTAFLGYLLVIGALLIDLGRPYRIWHAIVMWNPHSVMFEVAWCVMLYTAVLALEFSPILFEGLRWEKPVRIVRKLTIPLVIVGVILSTLHQSSLGSLYLIVPEKLYPLWYTPLLPVLFFISSVAVGLAMTVIESYLSFRAFRRHLAPQLLADLSRVLAVVLAVLFTTKAVDLLNRDEVQLLYEWNTESVLFMVEVVLGILGPIVLLTMKKVRQNPLGQFLSAMLVVLGFVMNRLNVSTTGMEASLKAGYFPSWMEIAVTAGIVVLGFVLFAAAVKHLPVFTEEAEGVGVPVVLGGTSIGNEVRAAAGLQ